MVILVETLVGIFFSPLQAVGLTDLIVALVGFELGYDGSKLTPLVKYYIELS